MHIVFVALERLVSHYWNITVSNVLHLREILNVKQGTISVAFESNAYLDKSARLIIRFSSDSVLVKLMQNMAKWP